LSIVFVRFRAPLVDWLVSWVNLVGWLNLDWVDLVVSWWLGGGLVGWLVGFGWCWWVNLVGWWVSWLNWVDWVVVSWVEFGSWLNLNLIS
jgi:hypothetical protein